MAQASSSKSDDTKASVAFARTVARAELRALDVLYAAGMEGPPICSALVRAARAVADFDAALRPVRTPSAEAAEAMAEENFEAAFPAIAATAGHPPPEERAWPRRGELYRARQIVDERYQALRTEARRYLEPRRPRRPAVYLAILGLALVTVGVLALRPRRWRVQYFRTARLTEPVVSEVTRDVGGQWDEDPPRDGVPSDEFSARWRTCIVLDRPRDIEFRLESDDGSRLLVDDRVVIDQWRDQSLTAATGQVSLAKGPHAVVVEYYERRGSAELSLKARLDGSGGFHSLPWRLLRLPAAGSDSCAP